MNMTKTSSSRWNFDSFDRILMNLHFNLQENSSALKTFPPKYSIPKKNQSSDGIDKVPDYFIVIGGIAGQLNKI